MTATQPQPPEEDVFLPYITNIRSENPDLGVPRLLAKLKSDHPEWSVSEKRVRKAVQSLSQTTPNGDATKGVTKTKNDEGPGLVAHTGIDPSITALVTSLAPKVKVKMFGEGKGKGLVAREKIERGEVIWQEDPWIVTADANLYPPLLSRKMCSHCFTMFTRPSPPLSFPCPHCTQAIFCNRLCYSKSNTTSHLDLLCPGQNPEAEQLWDLIRRSGGRYVDTAAKIIARWMMDHAKGDTTEIEKRVWEGMARVNLEEKEKARQEWDLFGDIRKTEWQQAHYFIYRTLCPSSEDSNYKAVQRILSKASKRRPLKPYTDEEKERWFSMDGFLNLLGVAALNSEDSGGLYALHAHINHNCDPNTSVRNLPKSFVPPSPDSLPCDPPQPEAGARGNNRITILARKTIHPGEELAISYVNPAMSRYVRRRTLRENYGFWCHCPRCKKEEGTEKQPADDAQGKAEAEEIIKKMELTHGFENANASKEADKDVEGQVKEADR